MYEANYGKHIIFYFNMKRFTLLELYDFLEIANFIKDLDRLLMILFQNSR